MVPAALAGYDVETILDRGLGALASGRSHDDCGLRCRPGVRFGAAIGTLAKGTAAIN